MSRRLRGVHLFVALALLAASCGDGGGSAGPGPTAFRPEPPSTAPPTTGELEDPFIDELDWYRCKRVFECATFEVPTDYRDIHRNTTHLTIQRIPARDPEQRIGVLLVNPGGPGGSGIEFVTYASLAFPQEVLDRFDIIGFDPRGVGESGQIDCIHDRSMEALMALDWTDNSSTVREGAQTLMDEIAEGCFRKHTEKLPYLGTVNAARDMEMIRRALEEEQISYVGLSYGTKLGAVYATLYPDRVRAMVLDGALVPADDLVAFSEVRAAAFEDALSAFAAACTADDGCPIEGDPMTAVRELLASLAEAPMETRDRGGRALSRPIAVSAIAGSLYDIGAWPLMAEAIGAARSGEPDLLMRLGDQSWGRNRFESFGNMFDSFVAIDCADRVERAQVSDVAEDLDRLAEQYPLLGADQIGFALTCASWPTGSSPIPALNAGEAAPLVVVGTTRDPATPYVWARELADSLGSAVALTLDGDGHTAFPWNDCMQGHLVPYLTDLTVPADAASCTSEAEAIPFGFGVEDLIDALLLAGVPMDGAVCLAEGLSGELSPADLILLLTADRLTPEEIRLIDDVATRCIEKLYG